MKDTTTRFPNPAGGLLSTPIYDSTSSLDLTAYLDACSRSNLGRILSTPRPSLSFSETCTSLDDDSLQLATPPHPGALKFLTTPVLSTSEGVLNSNSSKSDILISIPTSPRVRAMLMEPICVSQWTEKLEDQVPPSHTPWEGDANREDRIVNPPWIPEGSVLPPAAFNAILRHRRGLLTSSGPMNKKTSNRKRSKDASHKSYPTSTTHRSSPIMPKSSLLLPVPNPDVTRCSLSPLHDTVPTIMISNCTAMLPVSLESSRNLTKCAPLAVRRGQNLPEALQFTPDQTSPSPLHVSGSYPGIPSPFLGVHTPIFDCSRTTEATSIDLSAMCNDLRSRIPPLRDDSLLRADTPEAVETSSQVSEEDEWAFAHELETSFGLVPDGFDRTGVSAVTPVPAQQTPTNTHVGSDSFTPPDEDTRTDREMKPEPASNTVSTSRASTYRVSQPDAQKLQRRRTVIIETPEDGPRRRTRVTLDLSHLDGCGESTDREEALPIESDAPDNLSFSLDDVSHSTPTRRPPSSATLRPPAKGILKEKKSVRFSVLPSTREYSVEKETVIQANEQPSSPPSRAPTPLGRRLPLAPRSSLRQSSSPHPNIIMASAVTDHRISFPKHPMVKTIMNLKASPPRGKRESSVTVPANKTVSALSGNSIRTPLHPTNGRSSLPTTIPGNKKSLTTRISSAKENVGEPKKLRPSGTVSMPPRPRSTAVQDENKARRELKTATPKSRHESVPVVTKSRVPFRSMLAKLSSRAA